MRRRTRWEAVGTDRAQVTPGERADARLAAIPAQHGEWNPSSSWPVHATDRRGLGTPSHTASAARSDRTQISLDGSPDPFRVLAVPYDVGADDVRRAFRRLARETHPDRGGSADAFHKVRAAYGALTADLEGERRRWRPALARRHRAPRYPAGLDPQTYPTCPVRISRTGDGVRRVTYDTDARPEGWAPGAAAPPGGECKAHVAASEAAPAFGVWVVPLDANRFRCVFGPPPASGNGARSR